MKCKCSNAGMLNSDDLSFYVTVLLKNCTMQYVIVNLRSHNYVAMSCIVLAFIIYDKLL